MIDATDQIADLLSAASHAPDHGARIAYLGEARARLEKLRDTLVSLGVTLEAMEQHLSREIDRA
jgi:hypothetical protein